MHSTLLDHIYIYHIHTLLIWDIEASYLDSIKKHPYFVKLISNFDDRLALMTFLTID